MGISAAGSTLGVMAMSQVFALGVEHFGGWHFIIRIASGASCLIRYDDQAKFCDH